MRVAFTQNRDKAKDKRSHAESFAERLNKTLGRNFRRTIERGLNWERGVFGCRNTGGFTVDRASRGKRYIANAVATHRFEDVHRRDRVLFKIFARMIGSKSN